MQEIRFEIERLKTQPASVEELDTARFHFIGSLQAEVTTPFAHADKFKTMLLYNLQPSHYQNLIARIAAITPENLMETAVTHLNENAFIEVSVG